MKYTITGRQNISKFCFICGLENEAGLRTAFYESGEGELIALFNAREIHQSYPGRMHGGVAAAIMDETMGRAIMMLEPDTWAVTAELTVRYVKPVPLEGDLKAVGRVTMNSKRLFEAEGELLLPDGRAAIKASGRYMKQPISAITSDPSFFKDHWFKDHFHRHLEEIEIADDPKKKGEEI